MLEISSLSSGLHTPMPRIYSALALLLIAMPSCALARGPVGLPVTIVVEDRPTGTETHEPELHRSSSGPEFVAARDRQAEREAQAFARSFDRRAGSEASQASAVLALARK